MKAIDTNVLVRLLTNDDPRQAQLAAGQDGLKLMKDTDGLSFAPTLLGKPGPTRDHFIGWGAHPSVWFDRVSKDLGDPELKPYKLVWIRGQRFKLYNDGRLYDLEADLAEEQIIPRGNGSAEAEVFRERFAKLPVMTPERVKQGR